MQRQSNALWRFSKGLPKGLGFAMSKEGYQPTLMSAVYDRGNAQDSWSNRPNADSCKYFPQKLFL